MLWWKTFSGRVRFDTFLFITHIDHKFLEYWILFKQWLLALEFSKCKYLPVLSNSCKYSHLPKNPSCCFFVTHVSRVWWVLASLASTSKFGKGRLDHFIYAKYVLLYIK